MPETLKLKLETTEEKLLKKITALLETLKNLQSEKLHLLSSENGNSLFAYIHELGEMSQSLNDKTKENENYTNLEIQRVINFCNVFLEDLEKEINPFPYTFNELHKSEAGFSTYFKIKKETWLGKPIYAVYLIGNEHPDCYSNDKPGSRHKEFKSPQEVLDFLQKTHCI
jgi:hypothetical protein